MVIFMIDSMESLKDKTVHEELDGLLNGIFLGQ